MRISRIWTATARPSNGSSAPQGPPVSSSTTRPCQIQAGALKDVADWLERYRKLWDERLDRLGDYLKELQKQDKEKGK